VAACGFVASICLWLKKSFFLSFFSVLLDTDILRDITVVLLETIHTDGDIFVFVANVRYWLL